MKDVTIDEEYMQGIRESIASGFVDRGQTQEELHQQDVESGIYSMFDRIHYAEDEKTVGDIEELSRHISNRGMGRDIVCKKAILEDAYDKLYQLAEKIGFRVDDMGNAIEIVKEEDDLAVV
ncbi:MAG: hypothetical protein KC964_19800 [Candidatus Omnitrophica bacterium]|nr:hypothetical protein [Candidatus Omnitrophota bacterium]